MLHTVIVMQLLIESVCYGTLPKDSKVIEVIPQRAHTRQSNPSWPARPSYFRSSSSASQQQDMMALLLNKMA